MTAQELHDACHDAMCQCPQFRGWDDDQHFSGYGEFATVPRKGLYATVKFWKEFGYLLWDKGYSDALPTEVQELFDDIDRVIEQAVKDYVRQTLLRG